MGCERKNDDTVAEWFFTCSAAMAAACAWAWNSGEVASMAAMGEWYMEETEDS